MIVNLHLLASSSRTFASNSLLGGYFGKLEGSQGRGFIAKNCKSIKKKKRRLRNSTRIECAMAVLGYDPMQMYKKIWHILLVAETTRCSE